MKGQLSAEMLILIAVIIAVVAIAATRLITTAKTTSEAVDTQSKDMIDMSNQAVKGEPGDYCIKPEQCKNKGCNNNECS